VRVLSLLGPVMVPESWDREICGAVGTIFSADAELLADEEGGMA
jgi:hypothetical protein